MPRRLLLRWSLVSATVVVISDQGSVVVGDALARCGLRNERSKRHPSDRSASAEAVSTTTSTAFRKGRSAKGVRRSSSRSVHLGLLYSRNLITE
ncbi:uncharacterized protein BDZ99DRAFT_239727 [Mytilinidion resinicola]|uniref:Secreted protein n=1 Tax=Mytilinidion resinicola TaxID=574789 RepID=A0A6A6XYR8_9PEZI|nr:uncharacterized protein BDZ99DRAFT_239727 [Mytilinidion resinicola]KAF2801393.1 hypothetical protein BDZ99DRAFT_239727 [Mytilinidion resinicola]